MCPPRPDTAASAAGNPDPLREEGPRGQLAGWACVWTRATYTGQPLLYIPSTFQDGSKGHSTAPRVRWAGLPGPARGSSMSHAQRTAKSPHVGPAPPSSWRRSRRCHSPLCLLTWGSVPLPGPLHPPAWGFTSYLRTQGLTFQARLH